MGRRFGISSKALCCLAALVMVQRVKGGRCKTMHLTDLVPGMHLKHHLETSHKNITEDTCSIRCFLSDMCQSYNYNYKTKTCQTSKSTRIQHAEDMEETDDAIYVGTKNKCVKGTCPEGSNCKADFVTNSFTCIAETQSNTQTPDTQSTTETPETQSTTETPETQSTTQTPETKSMTATSETPENQIAITTAQSTTTSEVMTTAAASIANYDALYWKRGQ
ncbi:integumentary mucin A.1 [Nematostella vectensis]|uniref:integumentary mucin A.1 n=1 Tax=Nematostella vectensis TaxID=45351 RepID=UPI001390322C|nr:integumentary mucin A.1 [Nematostella vectensis]